MTNREAQMILSQLILEDKVEGDEAKAVIMAVRALAEVERRMTMADKYISAKQAYANLRSVLYETAINNAGVKVEDFASACEEIADNRLKIWLDDIPAADVVARKKGEWIEDGYRNLPTVCSYCGSKGKRSWKSCPCCGAEMSEENDDAEIH